MPSYRVCLDVGILRAGVESNAVLPAAVAAARVQTTVEAYDVAVVRGAARLTVRFTADDDPAALGVASGVHAAVGALARVTSPVLTRRHGGRWHPVSWTP